MYRFSERSNLHFCKIWKLTRNALCFAKNLSVLKLLRSLMPSSFSVRFLYCKFPFFSHSRIISHLGDATTSHLPSYRILCRTSAYEHATCQNDSGQRHASIGYIRTGSIPSRCETKTRTIVAETRVPRFGVSLQSTAFPTCSYLSVG